MLDHPGAGFIEGRILLVEENADSADVISECLTRAGAEIVGPVPTPAAARRLLQREQVDAVLFNADDAGETEAALLADELEARQVPSLMINGQPLPAGSRLHNGRAEMLWPFSEFALQVAVRHLVLMAQGRSSPRRVAPF